MKSLEGCFGEGEWVEGKEVVGGGGGGVVRRC